MSNSNRFSEKFKKADEAFTGVYGKELKTLMGLSTEEIDAITPGTTDIKVYAVLLEVVKEASRKNTSQAKLIDNIRELGEVAVAIAKKVPMFAGLL